jgi:antitoxin (DNA-binding transcriptional repressor) of toxin-antitoxin stability system
MKFITVRDIRTSPAKIWKELPEEQEMVITNNGKPIALLTPLSDESLEGTVSAVRQARAIEAVRVMQESARSSGIDSMSQTDIEDEIRQSRASRNK